MKLTISLVLIFFWIVPDQPVCADVQGKPIWFILAPMALMVFMPGWAMVKQMGAWRAGGQWWLLGFGTVVMGILAWMLLEGLLL